MGNTIINRKMKDVYKKMIGENLKKIRESAGIGLNQLSRMSGVNASYISSLERNEKKNPSVAILDKLATALGIPLDELLSGEYSMSNNRQPDFVDSKGNVYEVKTYGGDVNAYEAGKFSSAAEAMQFILKQPAIMGFGGFHPEDLSEKDIIDFANELLEQYKNLSYKYKYKDKR